MQCQVWCCFIPAVLCCGVLLCRKKLIIGDPVHGFTTLAAIMLFLGGIQLLTIGILGEYIGRIFNETKRRPVYVVGETDLKH